RNQVDELQKKLSSLKSQQKARTEDKSNYTLSERDKIIVEARSRLLSLQLQEQDLLKQYQESNRLVQNARKDIRLVQVFLKEQEAEISGKVRTGNPVSQEVEKETIKTQAELSSQNAKAAALTKQLGNLENEIRSFDLLDNDFQTLKREVASNEKNYRTYLERLEEARISEDMDRKKMANISVIQAATVPAKPVKPKKALNILLGMILGAVSGLGFAFFSEYTSESFSTPEIAEKQLALPVLTTIPHRD
ncbi:MAG TPA: GNVR domain-containing protein, partial [Candidatus Deferrimicrobium sp.]